MKCESIIIILVNPFHCQNLQLRLPLRVLAFITITVIQMGMMLSMASRLDGFEIALVKMKTEMEMLKSRLPGMLGAF